MYDPRVTDDARDTVEIIAEAVADERQLDGRRHLELIGEDDAGSVEASLRMVISREGELEECDLLLAAGERETAAALDAESDVAETEPLRLSAAGDEMEVEVEQLEDGEFTVRISGAEAWS